MMKAESKLEKETEEVPRKMKSQIGNRLRRSHKHNGACVWMKWNQSPNLRG